MKTLVQDKAQRSWTEAELATLAELRAEGLSLSQCASRLGRSKNSTSYAASRMNPRDTPKESGNPYHPPKPAQIIGPMDRLNPDDVASRVIRALSDLGALMLIRDRGQLVGAIPGSTPAQRAEARGPKAIVGTYWIHGADRQAIAEDIREALRSAA